TILTTQVATHLQTGVEASTIIPDQIKQQVSQQLDWQQLDHSELAAASPDIAAELESIVSSSISDAATQATQFAGIMVLLGAAISLLIPGIKSDPGQSS